MDTVTYRVLCKNCKNHEDITIDQKNTIYWPTVKYIISGRYRLDMQWGWQCICGNNDLVTTQERQTISNMQNPDSRDIAKVLKSIKPDEPKFVMEKI
jgi:hypothetical protein